MKRSPCSIAKTLKHHHSTISREIKKNKCSSCGQYSGEQADYHSKTLANYKYFFKLEKYNGFVKFFYEHSKKRIKPKKLN